MRLPLDVAKKTLFAKTMRLSSSAFSDYQPIPVKYTGDGLDVSPPLHFEEPPKNVVTYALIVEDPDAPKGTFDHWIGWNIPGNAPGLLEGQPLPMEGVNHFGQQGYGGPSPPPGPAHRYFFRLFALDSVLDLPVTTEKKELLSAIKGHLLTQAELVGTYQRK